MKLRKLISFLLSIIFVMGVCSVGAFAGKENLYAAELAFKGGIGPETDGYAIDYVYFSPVKENDSTKYPLVIWLHGMGNGLEVGGQLAASDIEMWATPDYQRRFANGGAFIFAPRSLEEKNLFWDNCLIYPLRAAIDSFIAENKDNIDLSRIYIGGYSMGGKMTLKMAVAYPELFAAAFPICPAWIPDKDATSKLADMPVWLTSGTADPLVNYFTWVMPTWKNIVATTNNPENCRFSTMSLVAYPNGTPTWSPHHAWYAVNNDMFSSKNGDYPSMKTFDGNGNKVKLTYPDGMISWLSGFTSDYDGTPATNAGNEEAKSDGNTLNGFAMIVNLFANFFEYLSKIAFA